jgi:hypothetical protein
MFYKIKIVQKKYISKYKLMGTELSERGTVFPSMNTKLPYTGTRLPYNDMKFWDTGMNLSFCITGPFLNFTDLSPPVGIASKQGTKLPYPETELVY